MVRVWADLLSLPQGIWDSFLEEVTFEWGVEGCEGKACRLQEQPGERAEARTPCVRAKACACPQVGVSSRYQCQQPTVHVLMAGRSWAAPPLRPELGSQLPPVLTRPSSSPSLGSPGHLAGDPGTCSGKCLEK